MGEIAHKGTRLCWENARKTAEQFKDFESLREKIILITGGTGLVGSQLVRTLIELDNLHNLHLALQLPVRNLAKLDSAIHWSEQVYATEWNATETLSAHYPCGAIVHCAAPTNSKLMFEHPAETLNTIIAGTQNCLRFADECKASTFIYLSSMEVYSGLDKEEVTEEDIGIFDPANPRNSYPIGKIASEALVLDHYKETGKRGVVLRLAQTFGAGVSLEDERVFAQFARSALYEACITTLRTPGTHKKTYVSVNDAIKAILFALTNAECAGVYNVSNKKTYCSIAQMGKDAISSYSEDASRLVVAPDAELQKKYAPPKNMLVNSDKLQALGWTPTEDLHKMYSDLITSWRELADANNSTT